MFIHVCYSLLVMTNYHPADMPHPEEVLQAAEAAVAPRVVGDYLGAIKVLRAKKFTFREIAEWLESKFGIPADHNSVWRAYARTVSDYEAANAAEADEQRENMDSYNHAKRNETGSLRSPAPAPMDTASVEAKAGVEREKSAQRARKRGSNK